MASVALNRQSAGVATAPEIVSASIKLYHLYEVSEAIDLGRLQGLVGPESSQARMAYKHSAPQYLQFQNPPLVMTGPCIAWEGRCSFQARVKFYDYGVASVTLEAPFAGEWEDFIGLGADLVGNAGLLESATGLLERYVQRLQPAFIRPAGSWMVEDYAVFGVHRLAEPRAASELAREHGAAIARLLRGERAALSDSEIAEVMRDALSYQPGDLAVIGWNAAFVFDSAAAVEATAEILEFANSQLLEFRYYDALLDAALGAVYDDLESGKGAQGVTRFFRSYRYRRTARRLSTLYLDVSELTEKTENSLKFFGDLYASRLYRLAAQKLGLNEWKTLVNRKLQSAASLYRSLLEEISSQRMQFMELAIVLILIFELAMKLAGGSG